MRLAFGETRNRSPVLPQTEVEPGILGCFAVEMCPAVACLVFCFVPVPLSRLNLGPLSPSLPRDLGGSASSSFLFLSAPRSGGAKWMVFSPPPVESTCFGSFFRAKGFAGSTRLPGDW